MWEVIGRVNLVQSKPGEHWFDKNSVFEFDK
jgi:hypothetical protein